MLPAEVPLVILGKIPMVAEMRFGHHGHCLLLDFSQLGGRSQVMI